ncbi:DUF2935 domain-containing protein [Brevibacillus composti]|uniref:DUF2935 domain-containing protein n=1 Tax=Brevibacillus composti TaxID=2796470 RepID=A0A7T5JPT7_9BACL|nr:DUF2935 domain-containing protein [Brevibacillus composti]QQE75629.1 DUF2935 domain-containing protein [Brevibacillus composti]QUO42655.1 DUF2935 domain-containing protein [Brevibacillus composti]
MQFYYDDKMPLRVLDEGEFWKQQEMEHTVVLRELAPNLEAPFVEALRAWEQSFAQTQGLFVRYVEAVVRSGDRVNEDMLRQIRELVVFAMQQSEQFIQLLNQMGSTSAPFRNNPVAASVLNHIRRESEYFIGITKALLSQGII